MSKYNRRHGNPNTSPWIFWIGGFALLAFLIWRMIDRYNTAKEIHAIEMQELEDKQNRTREIIAPDSFSEKQDTAEFK